MDEWQEGKDKLISLLRGIDADVQVVIPTKPTNGVFLISLTKGPNRKFVTFPEDDIIDLPEDAAVLDRVTKAAQDALSAL